MSDGMGRRERKKLATREALVSAALELFGERGFDGVTVAEIAERADVSTRTFFLHFPTKEDVLAGDADARLQIGLDALAEHVPGEGPEDALARAMRLMIDDGRPEELALGRVRYDLSRAHPSIRANSVRRRFEAEKLLAAALRERFDDRIDEIGAAALVAAVMAATYAAATTVLASGAAVPTIQDAMHRAVDIALWGKRRNG
ncbi:TetR family transcriptional regulator [Pseudonocardia sp. NPDC049635]|uniref:TetR/AcrR family transcriptional regulator n=1 Tax=Pseudonocardia sp. NPDC049635 TaxID=3155506 RepID=UPI0033D6EC70